MRAADPLVNQTVKPGVSCGLAAGLLRLSRWKPAGVKIAVVVYSFKIIGFRACNSFMAICH